MGACSKQQAGLGRKLENLPTTLVGRGGRTSFTTIQKINIVNVHAELCPNIMKDGWDPDRPRPGVAIWFRTEEGKKRNLDVNMKMTLASNLYPPILKDKMDKQGRIYYFSRPI